MVWVNSVLMKLVVSDAAVSSLSISVLCWLRWFGGDYYGRCVLLLGGWCSECCMSGLNS